MCLGKANSGHDDFMVSWEAMSEEEITAETKLGRILERPEAAETLAGYRFPCLSCPMAAVEMEELTLGWVAERYGLPLDEILEELNRGL